ncbi:MAG TPA: leucyl aminopeptidase [Geminicoccaceae bacterium]|jgi:leucyl aminopeptidase|nr:leucyl aminopeptidase [Geminicoccaceae bacterium]
MRIEFAGPRLPEAGTLVVLAPQGGELGQSARALDARAGGAVTRALQTAGETFRRGQAIELLYPAGLGLERVVVLGLGKPGDAKPLDLEALGGSLALKLKALRASEASVAVDDVPGLALGPTELAVALASGACLRSYRFEKYRTQKAEDEEPANEIAGLTFLVAEPDAAKAAWRSAEAVVRAVGHSRDLVAEPANVLSPERFAEDCAKLGSELGLEVDVLGPLELRELGMRALLGVSQGSAREPRVAVLRWQGGPEGTPPVALIGKGVCFDSGGLSIKPAAGMEEMKWDMGGAAAVFGAIEALARRRARANVVGVLGLTENMPSGTAQRPGDVITAMSGLTIEVINTDAEGRLVLADVLHYAKERFKPGVMIDLATLTGAIVVALGHEQAGLFTPDEELAARLIAAGEAVGERVWRMPLGDAYAKHIKSEIADIKNVGRAREAGATAGAVFLQRFVGDVPWAHLDIAGVAWTQQDLPLAGKGATGFGVRLLDRLIADYYEG